MGADEGIVIVVESVTVGAKDEAAVAVEQLRMPASTFEMKQHFHPCRSLSQSIVVLQ